MPEALYTREILRLAMSLSPDDQIDLPDGEATARSAVCGSEMTVLVKLKRDGSVDQCAISAKTCAMGQASAAILKKHAVGLSMAAAGEAQHELWQFLTGGGKVPNHWPELQHLIPAKEHPARHSAIMLPYKALLASFEDAAKHKAA